MLFFSHLYFWNDRIVESLGWCGCRSCSITSSDFCSQCVFLLINSRVFNVSFFLYGFFNYTAPGQPGRPNHMGKTAINLKARHFYLPALPRSTTGPTCTDGGSVGFHHQQWILRICYAAPRQNEGDEEFRLVKWSELPVILLVPFFGDGDPWLFQRWKGDLQLN